MNVLISDVNVIEKCKINANSYVNNSFGSTHKIFDNLHYL